MTENQEINKKIIHNKYLEIYDVVLSNLKDEYLLKEFIEYIENDDNFDNFMSDYCRRNNYDL